MQLSSNILKGVMELITKRTTIQLSQQTKDALVALGKKGDSYEDIIKMLIDSYEQD